MGIFGKDIDDYCSLLSFNIVANDERLIDENMRFRDVFDVSEIKNLNFILAIDNKKYLDEDWDFEFKIRIFNDETRELVYYNHHSVEALKEEKTVRTKIVFDTAEIEPGIKFKKGIYQIEVTSDDSSFCEREMAIVDKGRITSKQNTYFKLRKIKFCHIAGKRNIPTKDREYYSTFKEDELATLGIYVDLGYLQKKGDSYVQFQTYINHIDGTPKASFLSVIIKDNITTGGVHFVYVAGGDTNFWKKGAYQVNIHVMDTLIGSSIFHVSKSKKVEGEVALLNALNPIEKTSNTEPIKTSLIKEALPFKESKKALFDLIGLQKVKEEIDELATFIQFQKIRAEKGLQVKAITTGHLIFTGNPGTGKTTVAKLMGKIYNSLGVLTNGEVFEVGRADLVGSFIGQTATKTKELIEKARGGVLFVDEAYALARKGESAQDFGKEAVEVLMKEMSDGPGNLVIIFAGYPKEMDGFIESNPGIKSRIDQVIHFDDYTPEELFNIALFAADKKGVILDVKSENYIKEKFYEIYRSRDEDFGNARLVFSIIDEAKTEMAMRIMKQDDLKSLSKKEISTIILEDLSKQFNTHQTKIIDTPIDEKLLEESLAELNRLVGLTTVKEEITEIIKLVNYYRKIGKDFRKDFSLHKVFTGNPGTGKTTLARILVKIYKALGILERGHLVEVDRAELVGTHVGQTAPKTDAIITKALGGMLFIDEAYSLVNQGENDFGNEAIETLLKRMEDDRGKFTIVAAGYTNEMQEFLESNPGLSSRFDKIWSLPDYSPDELIDIAILMFRDNDLNLNDDVKNILQQKLEAIAIAEGQYFGNARSVRKVVDVVKKNQLLRMATSNIDNPTSEQITTILAEDLEGIKVPEKATRKRMGF